ncbi:styrene monooxygenase/indole monooxygenase family protein [Nocardia sp. 2YAB30]|uniref:styrene monooxygenase/indole monooxygenase family protein n=1 Tax=unclassified Nocardia TaxID=2637762 RepID=UPI003F946039
MQQQGIRTTLYADKTPEQIRAGRLPNNVCRFGRTRARERALGVDHWDFTDFGMSCAHVRVHTDPPIAFCGHLTHEASFVDFRIYLPQLVADYRDRGGAVVATTDVADAVARYGDDHDLMVVAAGGGSVEALFPRVESRSAEHPGRILLAGLFHGVAHTEPMGMHLEIVPDAGEIFQTPVHSVTGRVAGITFEAVPDGPWASRLRDRYYDDPDACARIVLELLRDIDSEILGRIDFRRFALTRPLDLLQGSITPTVRRPWARLGPNTYAVAVGDAAVLNDPVTGQGGNLAAAAAWELGQAILADPVFDERFCRAWESTLWNLAADVTEWTASALGPPPDHVVALLRAAEKSQDLADAYLDNFDAPKAMWNSVATPRRATAFMRRVTSDLSAEAPDHTVVDRERLLLDALAGNDIRALHPLVASDGILVTEDGCHSRDSWQKAVEPTCSPDRPAGFSVLRPADDTLLVTYRQGAQHCSTLWRRDQPDRWVAVVHHRSPTPSELP